MSFHALLRSAPVGALLALTAACAANGPDRAARPVAPGAADALFAMSVDDRAGGVVLTLPPADDEGVHAEFLLVVGIESGLGANDVGLDRGEVSGARLVRFRTVGTRVLLEERNTRFRAEAGTVDERRAADDSFADSVLWGAEPVGTNPVRIDVGPFLASDRYGVARVLKSTGQGSYSVDAKRSGVDLERSRAFPDNLEFASILTFAANEPGRLASRTAPDGRSLTFVQRVGFVRLPDDGYERRPFDPRMGAFQRSFIDYSVPLDRPIEQRLALRHRVAIDPATGQLEPIVYYVDRGAPEPVRSALVEGASWWSDAFAAAGYPGLFRVEVAPEGLDPFDIRHNFIQWVHRSTRGWSYGNSVTDPRTGEILKGHVSLGSLRVRHDRLLFEALLGVERTGTKRADDPVELALARIRQLAAHEVGHTLGLAHNFAASVRDRASVMDYPAPRVRPGANGGVDVSDAYAVGIGEWDRYAIRMLYEAPPQDEALDAFYDRLVAAAEEVGLTYLTDQDARSAGSAQPIANLWDDGVDPVRGLVDALEVRRRAIARFGSRNLDASRSTAELEEVFAPLWLFHRYQVDAAVKRVGGVMYRHTMNRGERQGARPVDVADQLEAMSILAGCIAPEALEVPDDVVRLLLPRPPGFGASRETFDRTAGAAFDWIAAAEVAARLVVRGLLHPERLLRTELQAAASPKHASLDTGWVMESLLQAVRLGANDDTSLDGLPARRSALVQVGRTVVIEEAMRTLRGRSTARVVREDLRRALRRVHRGGGLGTLPDLSHELQALLDRPLAADDRAPDASASDTPPGSPIGSHFSGHSGGGSTACTCSHTIPYLR